MFIWMPPTEAPDSRPAPDTAPENSPSAPDFSVLPDVPLRAIRDFAGMPLSWVQLRGFSRRLFELRCGEEILGLVHHEDKWGGPQGLARTKQGSWSFRGHATQVAIETDKGDRLLVRPYGAQRLFFGFNPPYADPTLSLPNGHDYFLKVWGVLFLTVHYMWLAADTTPLVTFSKHQGLLTIGGGVEVHPSASALPELDLLITLGLYLALTPVVVASA